MKGRTGRGPLRAGSGILATWLLAAASGQAQENPMLVGYYTSWSIYARNYLVTDIPAESVTHINYAFADIQGGRVVLGDAYADTDRYYPGDCWDPGCRRGNFHQLEVLKQAHPNLRTMISVGGWTWSSGFSDAAATAAARRVFARSCRDFLAAWPFDGVDLDWEYPVWGGDWGMIHRPEDGANYVLLLQAVRASLDSLEAESGRDCWISVAAPASPLHIVDLDLPGMLATVDWFNLMTYDFHGPWGGEADAVTHFNAPLRAVDGDPLPEPYRSQFNAERTVANYLAAGVPRQRLTVGLPFYGRGYTGLGGGANGLFAAYTGPLPPGTWESGVFDYWDLREHYVDAPGVVRHRHGQAEVPWLHHPGAGWMISYDDSLSLTRKVQHLRAEELGGAMFWEFSGDRDGELVAAVVAALVAPLPGLATPDLNILLEGGDIRLEWELVPGAARYRVEAAGAAGLFVPVAETEDCGWGEPRAAARRLYRVVALNP